MTVRKFLEFQKINQETTISYFDNGRLGVTNKYGFQKFQLLNLDTPIKTVHKKILQILKEKQGEPGKPFSKSKYSFVEIIEI